MFDVEQVGGGVTPTGPLRASGGTVELLDALSRQRGRRPLSTPTPTPTDAAPAAAEVDRAQDDDADDAAAGGQDDTRAHEPASPGPREPDLLSELGVDIPAEDRATDSGTQADRAAAPAARQGEPPGPVPAERRPVRKRRSSVPSWDDIVFGTRRDEGGSA